MRPHDSRRSSSTYRGLILAMRPAYLSGVLFFILGAALSGTTRGALDIRALSIGLVVMLLVHVITHYVNDAEDVATDEHSRRGHCT